MEITEQNSSNNVDANSEVFGSIPHASESFRKFQPQHRKETHTISVRDAAKMFEAAGVARTERSIINWCRQNRQGLARLDCYFDPNDRKYYITQQSIELAIKEELSKSGQKAAGSFPNADRTVPNASEAPRRVSDEHPDASFKKADELQKQIVDLTITNRAKDMYIEKLHEERSAFALEREGYVHQLMAANREVGELTTRLMQVEGPKAPRAENSEPFSQPTSPVG